MIATIIIASSAGVGVIVAVGHVLVVGYRIVHTLQATVEGLKKLAEKFDEHLDNHGHFAQRTDLEDLRDRVNYLQRSVESITSWRSIPPPRPPASTDNVPDTA